jgi:hypothetical protein
MHLKITQQLWITGFVGVLGQSAQADCGAYLEVLV